MDSQKLLLGFLLNWVKLFLLYLKENLSHMIPLALSYPVFIGHETARLHAVCSEAPVDRRVNFFRSGDDSEHTRAMTEMNGVYGSSRRMRIAPATPRKSSGLVNKLLCHYIPNNQCNYSSICINVFLPAISRSCEVTWKVNSPIFSIC